MANLQKYGTYSLETAAEEKEELAAGQSEYMKLKVGRNIVRFLPPLKGNKPFVTVHQHFINVPGSDRPVVFNCPRLAKVGPCPACERIDQLLASRDSTAEKLAKSYKANRRSFANVIDRAEVERGPKILAFTKSVHNDLVDIRSDEDGGGNFVDPVKGFDIIISREGTTKMDTRYKAVASRKSSQLENMEWIEAQHDLSKQAEILSYEEIRDKLQAASSNKNASNGNGSRRMAARNSSEEDVGEAPKQQVIYVESVDPSEFSDEEEDSVSW